MRTIFLIIPGLLLLWGCTNAEPKAKNYNEDIRTEVHIPELISSKAEINLDSLIMNGFFPHEFKDTIRINKINRNYPVDSLTRRLIKKGEHNKLYFYSARKINDRFYVITILEDEEETISISLYTIKNGICKGKLLIAESSAWELGRIDGQSVFTDDLELTKIRYSASRDWGDYTEWKENTVIEQFEIQNSGVIEKKHD